ncbi:hypothetical protein ACEZCY_19150 [Streptacidiphilus sp. N1-12]|uniref:Uncharacterized protein n=2 Tax=Streptacidiphilus alkalitolerans TaxID=3342712 RepID=A0ABV6WH09_9ACTN
MTETQPAPPAPADMPPVSANTYSREQLHEKACIICGDAAGELVPAGHVKVDIGDGTHLTWPVAAHPGHAGGRS